MDIENLTLKEFFAILENKDIESIVELLVHHKKRWNDLKKENKDLKKRIFLDGVNIRNKDLSEIDFSEVDIRNSDFSGSNLARVDFSGSNIVESNLSDTILDSSNMYKARISRTDLSYSRTYNIDFSGTYLTGSVNLMGSYSSSSPSASYGTNTTIERASSPKDLNELWSGQKRERMPHDYYY